MNGIKIMMMKPMKPKSKTDDFQLVNRFYTKQEFIIYVKNLSIKFIKTNKKIEYANVSSVIDIETSSFIDNNGNKVAIMYCFTIGINGISYFGRTYDELFEMLQLFTDTFSLEPNKRLVIYIHNLAYEFQFFYKRFTWVKLFAVDSRTPLTALTTGGIEFRCSYLLSGYSLYKTGEHLQKYKVKKKIGDLDYSKIRHSETPMTPEEIDYVLNDGLVVMAYIQEQIESHKNVTRIPLTKTGEVRKFVRDNCLYGGGSSHKQSIVDYGKYQKIMKATRIRSVNEYKQLKRAFSGGFTHANALIVGNVINNVTSFDFTSSYPYVIVSEKFPMLRGELVEIKSKEDFINNLNKYCCLFDITFIDLESTIFFEHYISKSHCKDLEDYSLDNGRIVDAKKLTITITEQDYFIIEKCYKWKSIRIKNFRRYKRGYLPTPFVKSVLSLYKDKTELKGIEGKESEYLYAKEQVNACYGMMVTDICRQERPFDIDKNQWADELPEIDYEKNLNKYNESKQRFLSYAWGIWVTAYARKNLWSGILEFGKHYLYSDTDSIKVIHVEEHQKYIDDYNQNVINKLKRAMEYHHISMDYCSPRSIDGKIHTLGLWDNETKKGDIYTYAKFKTLGAKRYIFQRPDGTNSLTVSGLNKKIVVPYLQSKNKDVFQLFKEGMYIPPEFTGKKTLTYIDESRDGIVTDYLGKTCEYHELSCVHMCGADYTLSLAQDYVNFLLQIKTIEYN